MRQRFATYRNKNTSQSGNVSAKARLVIERLEDRCLLSGATLTVNTLSDLIDHSALSLHEAIAISQGAAPVGAELTQVSGNPAGGNDIIVFSPGLSGTISLSLGELNGAVALSQNVTISGPGSSLLALQGVGTQILNNGTAGISLTISGVTIEDGFNGGPGGAILNNGILTLNDDIFANNKSTTGGGGAIANAAAGATLNVTGTTFINNSATGSGGGGAIFSPGAGISQTLTNCTFTNDSEADAGAGGGAIFSSGAGNPLTITNGNFTNNIAVGTGGAIDSNGASRLILTSSTFTGNSALNGGAVAATGSAAQSISVAGSSFSSNSAIGGTVGGGALDIRGNTSTVTIRDSSFSQNRSDTMGGAISSGFNTGASGTGVTIDSSTFTGNRAQSLGGAVEGGAFFDTNSPKLAITNSNFSGNFAISSTTGQGGALDLEVSGAGATPVAIANVNISGNIATTAGGGVFAGAGTLSTFTFAQISNNTASNGGGIDIAANSVVTLGQSTVSGNIATNAGGGVYNTATFNLISSTVSGNTSGTGGGIFSNSPLATNLAVINSTVADNVVTFGLGGGIYSNDVGAVLVNSTIALNRAGGGGGGFFEGTVGGATLTNTIVAQNTKAGAASDMGGANVVGTSGNNLIGTGGSDGLTNTNGNQIGVSSPGLNSNGLQNNGGPTLTIALIAGSPAIDNGTNSVLSSPYSLTTDQRGYSRLVGAHVDIGAYEANAINVTPVVTPSLANLAANATSLVIHGSGFSSIAANDTVVFTTAGGGVATGIVTSASTTMLTVTHLSGLTGGILSATVTNGGRSSANTPVATVIPIVTRSTASLGVTATTLIINGFGFDSTTSGDIVTFGGGETGTVSSATINQLTITMTSALLPGPLMASVNVNGGKSGALVEVAIVTPVVTPNAALLAANATTMTINGFGFSTNAGSNTVIFSGGAGGTVSHATTTQLTITNLHGLVAGNLTAAVTVSGVSSPAVQVATVTPVVTLSLANLAANATSLQIHGFGFSSIAANNTVVFATAGGGVATGTVTGALATTLYVTNLSGLRGGILSATVTSNAQSSANTPVAMVTPIVTRSTASLGLTATTLIINGFGFNSTTSGDTVTFGGGETGTVSNATINQLTITMTSALLLGPLTASVNVNGGSSGTPVEVAIVTANPVVVTPNADNLAANATTMIINGFGFSINAGSDTVIFSGGAGGTVSHATATQLTITNLHGLVAGNLTAAVTVSGVSSPAVQVATVTPVVTLSTTNFAANATSLVIHGFGFSSIAANNTIVFATAGGGVATGIVTGASATMLTVTHLSGLTGGILSATVTSNGQSSVNTSVATVIPVVTRSTMILGVAATTLIINGFGFNPTSSGDIVTFGGGETGTVSSATINQLTITMTSALLLGPLMASVNVNGGSSGAAVEVADVT